jgi:GT2 family glycosyltransferase
MPQYFSMESGLMRLLTIPIITCPTLLYKTSLAKKIGYFNTKYSDALDWEYQVRAVLGGYSIYYCRANLYSYRRHTYNETVKNKEDLTRYNEILDVYRTLFKNHEKLPYNLSFMRLVLYLSFFSLLLKDMSVDILSGSESYKNKFQLIIRVIRELQ